MLQGQISQHNLSSLFLLLLIIFLFWNICTILVPMLTGTIGEHDVAVTTAGHSWSGFGSACNHNLFISNEEEDTSRVRQVSCR